MAEAAEVIQTNYCTEPFETSPLVLNLVPEEIEQQKIYLASEAEYETFTQAHFNRWRGSIALQGTVKTERSEVEETGSTDLLDTLRQANAGLAEALERADKNVGTAVSEACFKDRHVIKVSTWLNEAGEREQFGQSTLSVHENAITMRLGRHEKLQEITHLEALNDHRIGDGQRAGKLKDNYFVVASIVPDGVPEEDLGPKGDGYFLDSLTFVLQATTEEPNGEIPTESAFIAGVEAEENDSFADRLAKRYDIKVLAKVYEWLRQKSPATAAEFLNNGLYIPKDLMPNGVVDFMRWCDEATDEIMGRDVERKSEDYIALIEESKRREASLEGTRQKVLSELLLAADELEKPMDAVRLMWQLVKKHTVDASFKNTNIDPRVFGREAAPYIMQVRHHLERGAEQLAQGLMQKAHEKSVVSGCGGGASSGITNQFEQAGYGNKSSEKLSWHGGKIKKGKCVNCKKHTDVGVENWCKKCIKC